jgi:hypothetical protein
MVKFSATGDDGKTLLGFGLSRGNIERLVAGQPIRVRGKDIHRPDLEVMIFFGETEADMEQELRNLGAIGENTVIHR